MTQLVKETPPRLAIQVFVNIKREKIKTKKWEGNIK